jgi:cellobiose transport system substrate-binding protein
VRRNIPRTWTAAVGVAALALTLTACSDDSSSTTTPGGSTAGGGEKITLTVATFNDFGYTDELLQEYMDANENITIVHNRAAESKDARANLTTRIASGGDGLADIEGIEIDWMPELSQVPDSFADLETDSIKGRWLDWKEAQGRTPDGKLIGYGTDIGPEAICYRSDLFEAAGLPTERDEVAELLGGADATWEDYFSVGRDVVAKSDAAWFDSANATFQGMIGQVAAAYEDPATGEPTDLASNEEVKGLYLDVLAAAKDLSGGMNQWSGDWDAAFQNDGFATMLCPAWMLGPIEERAGGIEGWDIADVFPGGGGNWGGSYLTVPANGKNVDEAIKLADWLTAPEQQAKAFDNAGTFPSQLEAQESESVKAATNDFFNDAPMGTIFSSRAQALTADSLPFKGANYFAIHQAVQDAITRVDVDKSEDPETAWNGAISSFEELGF